MPISQIFFWSVPVLSLITNSFIFIILAISKKDKNIKTFMMFLFVMILWVFSSLSMKLQLYPGTLFWNRIMTAAIIIQPLFYDYFVSVFTNTLQKLRLAFWLVLITVMLTANFMGYAITDAHMIKEMVMYRGNLVPVDIFQYEVGPTLVPTYIVVFLYMLNNLYRTLKTKQHVKEGSAMFNQVKPVIMGFFILFIGMLTNIIPVLGQYPFDILSGIIISILILYAIYKHRMLELRLIVTKGLVMSALLIIMVGTYAYSIVLLQDFYMAKFGELQYFYLIAFALVFVFQAIYFLFRNLILKALFKTEKSRSKMIKQFTLDSANNLNFDLITENLLKTVEDITQCQKVYLFIKNENEACFTLYATSQNLDKPDIVFNMDNPITKWFESNNECLIGSEVLLNSFFKSMWDREKDIFKRLEIEVISPLKYHNDLIGMVMLTNKKKNVGYIHDEIDALETLCASASVAMQNAMMYKKAQSEAITDSLTNLFNQRYFYKDIKDKVEANTNAPISLLILNLDMFRLYNDIYGHYEGDKALENIAEIISNAIGRKGSVSRYGGDQFAVLMSYCDAKEAYRVAENIRDLIEQAHISGAGNMHHFLTVSIGIAVYPHAASSTEELIKFADIALYNAKNNGKNRTMVYTPNNEDMDSEIKLGGDNPFESMNNTNYAATIFALTAAIDAKDHYTFGHSQRVAKYTCALATAIGMDKNYIEILRQAALLHDIGKIGIPESILTKTGKLTYSEYDTVKKHVEMSITIIKYLPSLNYVIPAVIGHHEHWDKNGYPRGIGGEQIPLEARCIAIADAFDAMTSKRQYKKALSVDYALNEIEGQAGKQFDPELAKVFVGLVRSGKLQADPLRFSSYDYQLSDSENLLNDFIPLVENKQ